MIEEHNKNIIAEFSKQAPLIAREKSSGFYTNVDWFCGMQAFGFSFFTASHYVDHLPKLNKEMTILEVAAGTCILAQALAPQVKKVSFIFLKKFL